MDTGRNKKRISLFIVIAVNNRAGTSVVVSHRRAFQFHISHDTKAIAQQQQV